MDHALSCSRGGYPSLRHNELRDLTAQLLGETCPNVSTELELQPLSSETLTHLTSNAQDGARLDVRAEGFGGDPHQSALIFQSFCNSRLTLASCYYMHEKENPREYDQRVREIEH